MSLSQSYFEQKELAAKPVKKKHPSGNPFDGWRVIKKLRKDKRCFWCGQMMRIGEPAEQWAGVFDRDFFSAKLHPECAVALRNSPESSDEDGIQEHAHLRGKTVSETYEIQSGRSQS